MQMLPNEEQTKSSNQKLVLCDYNDEPRRITDKQWSKEYMPRKGDEIKGTSPELTFTTKLKGEPGNIELLHAQKS